MIYKLKGEIKPELSIVEQILLNRGIEPKDAHHYLNTTDADINSPLAFGEDKMKKAATAVISCIKSSERMLVLVDADADGYTSSAILINYLHDLFPSYVENNLDWYLHSGKQHGLNDVQLDKHYNLIITPDSSSNDIDRHKEYVAAGTVVLVLDHHEIEEADSPAIIINNQNCDYPNKQMSGAGVTWQFCRYLDSLLSTDYANKYLDLVALGMDADVMSLSSIETKHLITKGFKSENVHNPFIRGMADKNSFSLGSKITATGAAWYIAPFINAMVRSGTQEEKEILFKSMLNYKAFEQIPSNKRGHKPGEMEALVTQALRVAGNVKNRQNKVEDEAMTKLESMIEEQDLLKHKVLLFLLEPGQVDTNVAGLVANKLMGKYQRCCCVLTRVEENGQINYQGSARGCSLAGIMNFKDICEGTGLINWSLGHQNAFGLSLSESKVKEFIAATDEILKDTLSEAIYYVDYIYSNDNIPSQNILDIAFLDEIWGKDMEEPYVVLKSLKIRKDMVTIYSKKDLTLKITLPNQVSLIMFHAPEELCTQLKDQNPSYYILDIVAQCSANTYGGTVSPQLKIKEWELIGQSRWDF